MKSIIFIYSLASLVVSCFCVGCHRDDRLSTAKTAESGNKSMSPLEPLLKEFAELHGVPIDGEVTYCINYGKRGSFGLSCIVVPSLVCVDFLKRLEVVRSAKPLKTTKQDPNVLGWGCWPQKFPTYVSNNAELEEKKLFEGLAVPVEEYSCKSQRGDWMHVDVWEIDSGKKLIRVYTHWND